MTSKKRDLNSEFVAAVLLYRLIEKDEQIPLNLSDTDFAFFAPEIEILSKRGDIVANTDDNLWEPTEKGDETFDLLLEACDGFIDLDVFSGVNLSLELPDDLFDEDGNVAEEKLDPRFEEPTDEAEAEVFGTTDLRLPVVDFLAERICRQAKKEYNPKIRQEVLARMIFLLEFGSDRFADDEAFFDLKLGGLGGEIHEIVESVPPWLDLAREFSPPEKLMEMIIEAGFLDAQKRDYISEEEDCVWLDEQKRISIIERMLLPLVS